MTDDEIQARRLARLLEALSPKNAAEWAALQKLVLAELYGGLWHTTHPDRFNRILASGAILAEPDIPDAERWSTSQGKDLYPYVRSLGGVSLFDFDQFDRETYSEECPNSNWGEFVPYRMDWGCSVWIEIDRAQVARQLISASRLLEEWKSNGAGRKIMPGIEAAHKGDLPRTAFKRAFLVGKGDSDLHTRSVTPDM